MLDVIRKKEIWDFMDSHEIPSLLRSKKGDLKFIQDVWVFSHLKGVKNKRIIEIGGGDSRLLRCLSSADNELWNYDEFKGNVGGPSQPVTIKNVKTLSGLMGSFDKEIPNDHFDVVFSISVVEHVPLGEPLVNFFRDIKRILKVGGRSFHAIDIYLADSGIDYISKKLAEYCAVADLAGLRLEKPSAIDKNLVFSTSFASNPDLGMYTWNKSAPSLKRQREVAQSVSLKMILTRDQ